MKNMSLKKASVINAAAKYSVTLMNILFSAILARLLSPNDYGIMAVLSIFTTLFARICDMGFGTAVIQFRQLTKEDINHIYSVTGIMAICLAAFFCLLGYPISYFYGNRVYVNLCFFLSFAVFFNCLNMIPNAVLLRNKEFITVAVRTVAVNMAGYILAIVWALAGGKYYSLAVQSVAAAALNYFWNIHATKLKWTCRIHVEVVRRIWKYSFFQFIFTWVNYFEGNLDQILIGGLMGSLPLAYYDRAYKLVSYPLGGISGVITPVLHPVLADYQQDKKHLYIKYMEIQRILSCLGGLIMPILIVTGKEIVTIVYGSQWNEAILAFQILCISIYPKLLMSTTASVYCSAGNTKMLFVAGLINAVVTCGGITVGVMEGSIDAVAFGVAAASWSNMIVTFTILMRKVMGQSALRYFKTLAGDIIIMFVITVAMMCIFREWTNDNLLLMLLEKSGVIFLLYMLYLGFSGKYEAFLKLFSGEKKQKDK